MLLSSRPWQGMVLGVIGGLAWAVVLIFGIAVLVSQSWTFYEGWYDGNGFDPAAKTTARGAYNFVVHGGGALPSVFSASERAHFLDVASLLKRVKTIVVLCLSFFLLGSLASRRVCSTGLRVGGLLGVLFSAGLGAAWTFSFQSLFTRIHVVFFTGNWQFDGASSAAVQLFPGDLWAALIQQILFAIFVVGTVSIALGAIVGEAPVCPLASRRFPVT